MSFHRHERGVFTPEQFDHVNVVYKRIIAHEWVTRAGKERDELARYILRMYERGMVDGEKLYVPAS
jgi:hypothetical protein